MYVYISLIQYPCNSRLLWKNDSKIETQQTTFPKATNRLGCFVFCRKDSDVVKLSQKYRNIVFKIWIKFQFVLNLFLFLLYYQNAIQIQIAWLKILQ